jgi:hypothetical protein
MLQISGDAGATERYPLLTFGSPLRRLYAENFPAYFGPHAMTALRDRLADPEPRWINLWAFTDPIGGWVFDPRGFGDITPRDVDCRIPDTEHDGGPVCGHSGFWTRPEYDRAVDVLQAVVTDSTINSDATTRPRPEAV